MTFDKLSRSGEYAASLRGLGPLLSPEARLTIRGARNGQAWANFDRGQRDCLNRDQIGGDPPRGAHSAPKCAPTKTMIKLSLSGIRPRPPRTLMFVRL